MYERRSGAHEDVVVAFVEDEQAFGNGDRRRHEEKRIVFLLRQFDVSVVGTEPEKHIN